MNRGLPLTYSLSLLMTLSIFSGSAPQPLPSPAHDSPTDSLEGMHTVYGQCPFSIAHTLWARPYPRRQDGLPRTPPSHRVPGCGAEALECDDSNESALSASPHVSRPPEPKTEETRSRRPHRRATAKPTNARARQGRTVRSDWPARKHLFRWLRARR